MIYLLSYFVYLFFGVLPSFLWLYFYLKKDREPEPKLLILQIFIYGGLITIPAVFVQEFILDKIPTSYFHSTLSFLIVILPVMAFVEELSKFLVVKIKALKNSAFNEPIDAMIYMITASLGFAAMENFLMLVFLANKDSIGNGFYLVTKEVAWINVFQISLIRFAGATFLHALCGAIIGFFIGLAFFKKGNNKLIIPAIVLTTFLHALYNFSIIKAEEGIATLFPVFLLIILYLLVAFFFKKLKQIKEIHEKTILKKD